MNWSFAGSGELPEQ